MPAVESEGELQRLRNDILRIKRERDGFMEKYLTEQGKTVRLETELNDVEAPVAVVLEEEHTRPTRRRKVDYRALHTGVKQESDEVQLEDKKRRAEDHGDSPRKKPKSSSTNIMDFVDLKSSPASRNSSHTVPLNPFPNPDFGSEEVSLIQDQPPTPSSSKIPLGPKDTPTKSNVHKRPFTNLIISNKPFMPLQSLATSSKKTIFLIIYESHKNRSSCIISRDFLCSQYGVKTQGLIHTPTLSAIPNNLNYLFPQIKTNPYAPRVPGTTGFMFTGRMEICENGKNWTCFVPKKVGRRGMYEFLGTYQGFHIATLGKEEFAKLDWDVQQDWCKKIINNRQWPQYSAMRCRIYLRFILNREPSDKEVVDELLLLSNTKKDGKSKNSSGRLAGEVTIEMVKNAFEKGQEHLQIVQFKCTAYGIGYANNLQLQFDQWDLEKSMKKGKAPLKEELSTNINEEYEDEDVKQ